MITDAKISSAAKISPAKIAPAQVGQLMVAQADGKYAPVTISGDANLAKDGKLRLKNLDEITERALAKAGEYFNRNEEALKRSDLKKGKTLVGGATTPVEVPVGSGANAIPQRDSSGNLKAETADQATNATTATTATNADKLDNQDGSHYLDVENHTGSSATAGDVTTSYKPHKIFEVAATSSNASNTPTTFTHSFGYIPDVTVYEEVLDENDNVTGYSEIDVDVTNTTSSSSINVSEGGVNLKVVIK
jgi:hypothetical protein